MNRRHFRWTTAAAASGMTARTGAAEKGKPVAVVEADSRQEHHALKFKA